MSADLLVLLVVAVIVITLSSTVASKIGVAGPLVLVAVGVCIGLIPAVPPIAVQPELILVGVLPPLLYSSAVSAPAIELRRDLRAVGGLAILLVIVSSVLLGFFFAWAIPGLGLPLAIALGAILSPTDAVATSIVRKQGVPQRVVALLEGESLLNDASALVILRTAIAATAAGFSFVSTLGAFAWAVLSAIAVGVVAGVVAMRLRSWTKNATASTAIGLVVPYLAYLPTDAVGGSGLVAAVVAGIICAYGSVRWLTPEQRISDKLTWRTVAFLLEGAVFLIMGLELFGILQTNLDSGTGIVTGVGLAMAALGILLLVRAAYVFPMLALHSARVRRSTRKRLDASDGAERPVTAKRAKRISADVDYFDASPLTWRHSVIVTWAGMRGVVTLAAAQTLPRDIPERDLLVLIAFVVSMSSLLLQGLTLPTVARIVGVRPRGGGDSARGDVQALDRQLRAAARSAVAERSLARKGEPFSEEMYEHPPSHYLVARRATDAAQGRESLEFELAIIAVMRQRLREIAASGRFSTGVVRYVFDELDAYEISVRLHLESES